MKIAVAGLGYVGLSNAALLSQNHNVIAVDINSERVDAVNRYDSPIEDVELSEYLATQPKTSALPPTHKKLTSPLISW